MTFEIFFTKIYIAHSLNDVWTVELFHNLNQYIATKENKLVGMVAVMRKKNGKISFQK